MGDARVESHLVVSATDAASVELGKTRKSIKALGDAATLAGKQGKDAAGDFKQIGQTSGDMESALKGLSDFSGAQSGAVSKVGDAFGAVEAVTRLLPGQLGLAATAIGAAGVGAYMLVKHLNEVDAKVRLLTSAEGRQLGEGFKASTDEIVKLTAALDSLGPKGLRPSEELLRRVRDNAIAVGADGGDAVAKFIEVWKQGPKAINDSREAMVALGGTVDTLAITAKKLGLDPKALGLVETVATSDKLKASLSDIALSTRNLEVEERKLVELKEQAKTAQFDQYLALTKQIPEQQAAIVAAKERLEAEREGAKFLGKKVSTEQDYAKVAKEVGDIQNEANGQAATARTKQIGLGLQLGGIEKAQEVVVKAIAREQDLITRGTGKEAEDRKKVLQGLLEQLGLRQAGILAGDQAAKRQLSQQGASEAAARRVAGVDAALRLQKAQADADGVRSIQERIGLIDAEAAKELGALDRRKLGRQGAAKVTQAIELERVAKVRQVESEVAAEGARLENELAASIVASNERSTAIVIQLADVRAQRSAQLAESEAAALEQTGQLDAAVLVRRAAAAQSYADEVKRINREIDAAQAQLAVASEDRANLELVRSARLAEAADARAGKEAALAERQAASLRATITASAQAFGAPLAKLGDSKIGQVLTALSGQVGTVAASWKGLAGSAPDAISALGAVSAAGVEGTTKQAFVQAGFESAAALASFAIGNGASAAQHLAAAAGFAVVAGVSAATSGGASAAATSGASGPSGAGGFNTGSFAGGGATIGGGGGKVENYYFNQPLVTEHSVGKAVNRANRSLDRTGYAQSRGR